MRIRSIPELKVFIEQFCKIAEENFGLSKDAIRIKSVENKFVVVIEIDPYCNDKLLAKMFTEELSPHRNYFFALINDVTTYSFDLSYKLFDDIQTLIMQYIGCRANLPILPILSQTNEELQAYNDSKANAVQPINHTSQPTINHREVIMYTISSLIPLLDRASDWYTSMKSTMNFYTNSAPTVSRVKLELENFCKSKDPFSSISLQTLISLLDQRRKHINTLDGRNDEKGHIDTILNSAQALLSTIEKQPVQTNEKLEDFVILGRFNNK